MPRQTIDFKGLSLDRLETLSRVVRHGSITAAAGGVASTQTQFSRQVAELETYFGVKLLDRSSAPHRPTAAAVELARLTDAFLAELGRVPEQAAAGRRPVVIGAGDTIIRTLLLPAARPLLRHGVRPVLRNLTSRSIGAELQARRLDVGILHPDRVPGGCEHRLLPSFEMAMIAPAGAGLPRTCKWSHLAGRPLAMLDGGGRFPRFVHEQAQAAGTRLDVALECSSSIQVIDAVRHCGCLGFVPALLKRHLPEGVIMVKLAGLEAFRNDYAVAWRKADRSRDAALDRVLAVLLGAESN